MELADTFIPTAGTVGLMPMVTYFFLIVTTYAFLGTFLFAWATRDQVVAEHRTAHILTAVISAIAGLSYFLIQGYYHDLLVELGTLPSPDDRRTLIRESYSAINQYRYMDWAVTTPLLLVKMVLMLRLSWREQKRPLTILLLADFFMILTGFIGEQQLSFGNEIQVGPKLIWGAVSTVGYVLVLLTLYRLWQQFAGRVQPRERWAYRLMALTTVTFWGVYPIGYILTVFDIDLNWIHIAFSVADLINKAGVGLVAYVASTGELKPLPDEISV
ncbi:bacteriorhodopsin [Spirosoma taeanense]|uniref:Bacteriorhodopsin n=1 Tax=Spirosoma taeanense TaxID=2735870 RepID=A0A6M5YC09_9BACT|nr:bacteriorhodopsin [Spirosoma taeanense]QJW91509.1 bacteriorhodopsin [Spirosoma taeanense]